MVEPTLASYTKIKEIVSKKSYEYFIWPDEELIDVGKYETTVEKTSITVEPLLIDVTTAHMLNVIHDALRPDLQKRMEIWISKSRAHFARIVEFGWDHVSNKRNSNAKSAIN